MIGRVCNARARAHLKLPLDNHAIARLQPLLHNPVLAHAFRRSDGAELHDIAGPHRQHCLFALQLLNPDLAARGNATVQATIRGALRDPQLGGRLELRGASLYLGDFTNGIDNANGAFVFDRSTRSPT